MISNLLLVCGVAVLTWAFRCFRHPLLLRAGTIGVFVTSFLAGWLLGGSLLLGFLFASLWLFLPWLEILTRIRKLRLPRRHVLEPEAPPTAEDFPSLRSLTNEIEELGFTHIEDAGSGCEEPHHFYRLFYDSKTRTIASICLIEQEDMVYFYVSFISVTPGRELRVLSWNYPFAYSMKIPPSWKVQRLSGELDCESLLEEHLKYISKLGIQVTDLAELNPNTILEELQDFAQEQLDHNVHLGVLEADQDDLLRYTPRGMFFLWRQFLYDLVRLS